MFLSCGLPAVVLRPSHVYGPGGWYAKELVPRLTQPGRFAVIGSGANLWDVLHVQDLLAALMLAVDSADAPGGTFHVADDEPITFYEFMRLTAEALGVGRPRRIPAPVWRDSSPGPTRSMRLSARPAPRTRGSRPSSAGRRASRAPARVFPMRSPT